MGFSKKQIGHRNTAERLVVSPKPFGGAIRGSNLPSLPDSFGKWIAADGAISIRADLTFRQVIFVNIKDKNMPSYHRQKIWINDRHAKDNISHFLHRLNYDCYKSAYKRYGKRIKVSSAIQGGVSDLRNEKGTKRLHAHMLLEKPNHIDFDIFKSSILNNWMATKWGYNENLVEEARSVRASAAYQVIDKMDSLDIQNTYLG